VSENADQPETPARRAVRDHLADTDRAERGLRERKKILMRQLISDTATLLFLEKGFDEVRVSEVAAACDVSEQTVYNYFPTKESLVLDREEKSAEEIRRALGPGATATPVDAVVAILTDEINQFVEYLNSSDHTKLSEILLFNELIESTPSLRAARSDMIERLAQVAAEAMATRAGLDPSDPEPQIAADALLGLWRFYYRAIIKHSSGSLTIEQMRDAVLDEVRRAARLLDSGLWSFATVVQDNGRQQFQVALDASNDARKQVLLAMKQAKDAWRQLKSDVETRTREEAVAHQRARVNKGSVHAQAHQKAHLEAMEIRLQAQQMKRELKEAARRARKPPR
jgi:AcrR family transcriptional regulator